MNRVEGNAGVKLLECTNPKKDKWRIRWDIQEQDDGNVNYMEEEFDHKPTDDEIKNIIFEWYNKETDREITSGFKWNGYQVWLSMENQLNYKTAFDAAIMSNGATLPVTFKFGNDKAVYHEFTTIDELSDFYNQSVTHVQATLLKGWKKKDSFCPELYQ